jgi:tetrahydromethanopterin S-methyltransferase subunit A
METGSKVLNFSSLDDLSIPEIKDIAQTTAEETHEEIHNEAHEEAIQEVESIESLDEDDPDDTTSNEEEIEEHTQTTSSEETEEPIDQIAKWGHELGILDFDEEDYKKYDDKEEYFKDKFFEKAKKLGTESLPPVVRDLAEKYIDGVPLDELIGSMSNQQRLENIDDETLSENTQLQENLVAQYLSLQDYEEDEIKAKLEKYKDSLLLEDEAKTV